MIIAAELQWLALHGQPLALQGLLQVNKSFLGVFDAEIQAFFPIVYAFALIVEPRHRVYQRFQAEFLGRRVDQLRVLASRLVAQSWKFQRQQIEFDLQQKPTQQRPEGSQFGTKPTDPAGRLADLQFIQGLLNFAAAQVEVTEETGRELMLRALFFQALGFDQSLVPTLHLSQNEGPIEGEYGGLWGQRIGLKQCLPGLVGLLGLELYQRYLKVKSWVEVVLLQQFVRNSYGFGVLTLTGKTYGVSKCRPGHERRLRRRIRSPVEGLV